MGLSQMSPAQAASPLDVLSSDGSGSASFTTAHLHAGMTETFCLVFTATSPISIGGGIRIIDPDFRGMGWAMWQQFQHSNPLSPGYLSAVSSNGSVTPIISRTQTTSVQDQSYTTIIVTSDRLEAGDVVTLCMTNGRTPHRAYNAITWDTLTDSDGDGTFSSISILPSLRILPSSIPKMMVATGPTYVPSGIPFTLTVRVLDEYSNHCTQFSDTIAFTSTDPAAALPGPSLFPTGDGVRQFSATLSTEGIQYIYVDSTGPLETNSNPFMVVNALAEQPQLFWGDLHGHHGHIYTSTLGHRVDEYMEYARDIADLDFVCESHKSSSYFNTVAGQVEVEQSVLQYNDPGRFVTFRGYEWMGKTGTQGHHNVYFSGPTTDVYYSPDDPDADTLDELWTQLEFSTPPDEAIAPPHAPLQPPEGSGHNWDDFSSLMLNRQYRPLAEMYSHWGSSEIGDGSVREALIYGNRVGFYGSSDTHFAYPGNPQTEAWGERGTEYVGGLAAVRAAALSRAAIWSGLKTRRIYATEGERVFLDFTVDGYQMGSELFSITPPRISGMAAGTAPISQVEVFKGGYVAGSGSSNPTSSYYTTIYSDTLNEMVASFVFTDTEFDDDAFYYLRVTQTDGKRAWSSPVWVDYSAQGYDQQISLPLVVKEW
jgi:hypothetical protein